MKDRGTPALSRDVAPTDTTPRRARSRLVASRSAGFYLLATWIAKGGARRAPAGIPAPLIFAHILLAAPGLIVWIIYVVNGKKALAWAAFVVLAVVALLLRVSIR